MYVHVCKSHNPCCVLTTCRYCNRDVHVWTHHFGIVFKELGGHDFVGVTSQYTLKVLIGLSLNKSTQP